MPSVTVDTLYRMAADGEDMFVIDVRTEPEYRDVRVSFVDVRITHDSIEANLEALPSEKTTPIYSICRGGVRSGVSTCYLLSIGYVNAYNVTGGMLAWQEKGYPTISDTL